MKKTIKKLSLKTETIKQLDETKLIGVVGGITAGTSCGAPCPGTWVTCSGCNTNCICSQAQSVCVCTAVACSIYPTCTCGAG